MYSLESSKCQVLPKWMYPVNDLSFQEEKPPPHFLAEICQDQIHEEMVKKILGMLTLQSFDKEKRFLLH